MTKQKNEPSDFIKKAISETNTSSKLKKNKNKINYKNKLEILKKYNNNLKNMNLRLELENKKNIYDFQTKAKLFSSKAQIQINQIKQKLNKKTLQDKEEMKLYGSQKLLETILEPINNIKTAIIAGKVIDNPSIQSYVQGFEMLIDQLFNELNNHGLKNISPKLGDEFDSKQHEALSTIEGKEKNKIIEVKKIGFKLHNRIIKPAIVIISK